MKILIIEDEPSMQEVLKQALEQERYRVESAEDFETAMDKILAYEYDCILLDIMLPGGSGLGVLQELKKQGKSDSVIILSAKDSVDDKIEGLNLGADDYLTKPFHIAELQARIKSVLRRKIFGGQQIVTLNNVQINYEERSVSVADVPLPLNRKEFDILTYFAANKNRLINKASLAEHVWGDYIDQADDFDFIYSQIKNLRKKLKKCRAGIEIQAVYGLGYKLVLS
ncbi:response regulator transcription factor [Rapidithrix thailandica]|uniref:Response regulator transcription factor n=1 Tax=Rapidithrix thailandica TaxID=413964 RepID=A0AAW9SDY5_9BACT